MIPEIWAFDYVLGFLYLFIIYILAFIYKNEMIKKDSNYKFFIPALLTKLIGGLGFLFLSLYYWKGGDTFTYYQGADGLTTFFLEDPIKAAKVLLMSSDRMNWYEFKFANGLNNFLSTNDSFTTVKITAIINFICFKSYVASTIVFSSLSFFGVWNMYIVFCKVYPHLRKRLLYGFFFIPSVILWGSGILKDTITIAAIGWLIYSFMNLVILKRKTKLSILLIILSTFFIFLLKPYILYIIIPCLFIWVQANLKEVITNNLIRNLISPFIGISLVVSSFFLSQKLSENAGKYDVNKIEDTLEGFQSWHTTLSETKDQSGYTLGEMEFTPIGMMKKIPAAIEVTFFRPYMWEIRNASTLLGGIEGLVLLIISLWLLLKFRGNLFRVIYRNKDILFLILFSLIFGAVVGISSYNFGALSRYKMPAQMFFVIAIILIIDKTNKKVLPN